MGETSQSRYSILERLTNKKLSIMDKAIELDNEINNIKLRINSKENKLVTWERGVQKEIEADKEERISDITQLKQEIEHLNEQKQDKAKTYEAKIKVLDEAIKSLNEISKTAIENK